MQHDLIQLTKIAAHELRSRLGHILMRRAVKAIAPNPIVLSKITRNRVRRRSNRQRAKEGGIEDRNMRNSELRSRSLNAQHGARIVQWREGNQISDLLEHLVIDDRWIGKVGTTMDYPVADRAQAHGIKINTSGRKIFSHGLYRCGMISNGTTCLADPLDEPLGLDLGGLWHNKLVLQRRRASVEHQDWRLTHV